MSFRPLARQIGLYPQVAGKITVTPIQQFPSPLEVIGLYPYFTKYKRGAYP